MDESTLLFALNPQNGRLRFQAIRTTTRRLTALETAALAEPQAGRLAAYVDALVTWQAPLTDQLGEKMHSLSDGLGYD